MTIQIVMTIRLSGDCLTAMTCLSKTEEGGRFGYCLRVLSEEEVLISGEISPHLVALRVLGQDCSSGACEQNWSAYSLIHTKIRNKLSTKQLEQLIYFRSNLRMLRSMHVMPMARQVNVDECKLSIETLKSLNKDRDAEEEQISETSTWSWRRLMAMSLAHGPARRWLCELRQLQVEELPLWRGI
ncbi:hypothetical protein GOP47_0015781 [Adiantum capillus-veneris]|uniref:HAT C-terminal dimerisation domain-containing protein n=1 Tax=Adiantum capillus-veneris TaxID=13818 RepID=A0A9D4UKC7_ADICA|nr:hypothetical protein GOP47_0015781 [Adiantum capillus-veneris]